MNRKARTLIAISMLTAAPAAFAQYTLTLTGAGNSTVQGEVYVSPYNGTIQQNGAGTAPASSLMICDDFTTNSYLGQQWQATATAEGNAGNAGSAVKFLGGGASLSFDGGLYSQQQAYNAAGWLATQLVQPSVMGTAQQTIDSFAIWNIFDGGSSGAANSPEGDLSAGQKAAVLATEQTALTQYSSESEGTVTIFTPTSANPNGINQSQEFLVVTPNAAPEIDPASASGALALLVGGFLLLRGRRLEG